MELDKVCELVEPGGGDLPTLPLKVVERLRSLFDSFVVHKSSRPEVTGCSVCVGLTSSGGFKPSPTISSLTVKFAKEVKELINLIVQFLPKDFHFTSIQCGRNTSVKKHRDVGNLGISAGLAMGDFSHGGVLCVEGREIGRRNAFTIFDGRHEHWVTAYDVRRCERLHYCVLPLRDPDPRQRLAVDAD